MKTAKVNLGGNPTQSDPLIPKQSEEWFNHKSIALGDQSPKEIVSSTGNVLEAYRELIRIEAGVL